MSDVHPDDFKGALGAWASGVTVVTTKAEGLVYGITVSSFSSLSMDPLLIIVCLANSNKLPAMVEASRHFAVSILAEGQDSIASFFATSKREPVPEFEEIGTIEWKTGSPIIDGAIAHLDCEVQELLPGGDHTIAVGRVVGAASKPELNPLMYFRRAYRTLNLD
jgi:flavin reductase (DIM6/NTAB) family NADH-FMN oxidoreductase RutF